MGSSSRSRKATTSIVMAFPTLGTGEKPVRIDKRRGRLPVTSISKEGGNFPRWRDNKTVEFLSGPRYYAYDIDDEEDDGDARSRCRCRVRWRRAASRSPTRACSRWTNRKVIERGTLVIKDGRIAASARVRRAASTG